MSSMWNEQNFKKYEMRSPVEIIQEQCDELYSLTNGIVFGRISQYDDPIFDFNVFENLTGALSDNISTIAGNYKVQDSLGEIGENSSFTYEFYLTSRKTTNYKFRAFFIEFKISFYPVVIVLAEEIAKELKFETIIRCSSEDELIDKLCKILSSNKITLVINSLLSITN